MEDLHGQAIALLGISSITMSGPSQNNEHEYVLGPMAQLGSYQKKKPVPIWLMHRKAKPSLPN